MCSVVTPCHILLFLRIGCNIKDVMTRSSFGNTTTYDTINHQTTVSMLDVSGRPETRDYGKALEALKLLTENVSRGPHNRVMGTTCFVESSMRAHNYS